MKNNISILGFFDVGVEAFKPVIFCLSFSVCCILFIFYTLTNNATFGLFSIPFYLITASMFSEAVGKRTVLILFPLCVLALGVSLYLAFFDWHPSYKEQRNNAISTDAQILKTHPGFSHLLEFNRCRSSFLNNELECLSDSIVVVQSSGMSDTEIAQIVGGLHKMASGKQGKMRN